MRGYLKSISLFSLLGGFHSTRTLSATRLDMSLTRKAEIGYHGKAGSLIIGVDEAGRGPLAGPVVTAACFIENDVHIDGINDSKQTKEEEREAMYAILTNHPRVHWEATVVSHTEIDEVNILQATMNGMRRSTEALHAKLKKIHPNGAFRALIDGNRVPTDMPVDATCVIKGDSIIFSIAAASIIAKVTRDRLMLELDKEFPVYNFAQHKGYPTFAHRSLLMQHGPCRVHRTSYAPVKLAMAAHGITDLSSLPSPASAVAAVVKTSATKGGAAKAVKAAARPTASKTAAAKPGVTKKAASKAARTAKAGGDTKKSVAKKAVVKKAAAHGATAASARAGRRASSQSVDSLALLTTESTSVGRKAAPDSSSKSSAGAGKTTKKAAVAAVEPKVRRTVKDKSAVGDAVEGSGVAKAAKGKRPKSAPSALPVAVAEGKKRKNSAAVGKTESATGEQNDGATGSTRKSARLRH